MNRISVEQGKKLNEVFRKYGLVEMNIDTVGIWFSNGRIYRDINKLDKNSIFDLFSDIRYSNVLTSSGKSILKVELIVDSQSKRYSISIIPY